MLESPISAIEQRHGGPRLLARQRRVTGVARRLRLLHELSGLAARSLDVLIPRSLGVLLATRGLDVLVAWRLNVLIPRSLGVLLATRGLDVLIPWSLDILVARRLGVLIPRRLDVLTPRSQRLPRSRPRLQRHLRGLDVGAALLSLARGCTKYGDQRERGYDRYGKSHCVVPPFRLPLQSEGSKACAATS